jgi:uncharacterized protein YjbI with pentapeptide repeats
MIEIKHKQTGKVLLRLDAESLEGANLTSANLAGANLTGVKISHACLRNADLQGAMLERAELIGTCLDHANLTQASLDAADLTDASLQNADLTRAHLIETTLRYAKLSGANFTQARLRGANLSMADARANLRGADLQMADLRGANLTGANLQQADLLQADLSCATMTKAVVAGARMQGAKMQGVVNDEMASHVEATTRASMIRRNPASSTNGFQLGGRVLVNCPYCGQQQEVPPQRVEHHSRCVTCKERFFVDRLGNATEPRKAPVNQWTPEMSSITLPPGSATWEWPKQLTKPLLGTLALFFVGGLLWLFLPWVWGSSYEVPDDLMGRATFVGDAFAAGDVNRMLAVTSSGTSSHMKRWFNEKRHAQWAQAYEANPTAHVNARVLFEGKANRQAGMVTTIQGSAPSGTTPLALELVTFWEQDAGGDWWLDGESTARGNLKPR